MHSELFSKTKNLINIFLNSQSDSILLAAVDLCKKKSVNAYFGPYINLVNGLDFFLPDFSNLFQAFKSAKWHCYTV